MLELEDEKKCLSTENMKKLKSRFIEIVNDLEKGDRKRKEIKFLPSIQTIDLKTSKTARQVGEKKLKDLEYSSRTIDLRGGHNLRSMSMPRDMRPV